MKQLPCPAGFGRATSCPLSWLTKAVTRHGFEMVRMSKYCNAVDRRYYGHTLT